MEDSRFVVYPPRLRFLFYSLGAIIMIIASLFVFTQTSFYYKTIALIGIIFSGLGLIFLIYRLIFPSPSLIVDNSGITDKSAVITFGFLRWDQIEKIYTTIFMEKRMLAIVPKNCQDYIAKSDPIRANLYKMNLDLIQAPFAIAEQNLSVPLEKVIIEINKYFPVSS